MSVGGDFWENKKEANEGKRIVETLEGRGSLRKRFGR